MTPQVMRMTRLHILHLIIMAALVSVIAGACRQSPAPSSILQEIDLLLSSAPDSAYVRLQTIDTCLIRSDEAPLETVCGFLVKVVF